MARKTRSDARLPKLTKEQKELLLHWLDEENMKLAEVVRLIYSEFDIKTNKSSVSDWYSSYCFSRDVRAASELAGNLREELENLPVAMDSELISQITQARFESQVAKDGDLKGHVALRKLRQKDQSQALATRALEASMEGFKLKWEQAERKISLDREKFESQERRNAEAREKLTAMVANKGGLTPETIEQIEEALRLL